MSEGAILLCGPALDESESAESLQLLRSVSLPNATKYVVTVGKFDTQRSAQTFNAEAGHPAETPHLLTLAGWAEGPEPSDPQFRDGYDLFCLRGIIAQNESCDYALLLREVADVQDRWPILQDEVRGRLFVTFGSAAGAPESGARNVLLDLTDNRMPAFLQRAWDLYSTGAAYGVEPYSLDRALATVADALQLEREICSQ